MFLSAEDTSHAGRHANDRVRKQFDRGARLAVYSKQICFAIASNPGDGYNNDHEAPQAAAADIYHEVEIDVGNIHKYNYSLDGSL